MNKRKYDQDLDYKMKKQKQAREYYRLKKMSSSSKAKLERNQFSTTPWKDKKTYYQSIWSNAKCVDCGENRIVTLEFDHRDPASKRFNISSWRLSTISLQDLKDEIDKCDVVCANCHRVRTAERFKWAK